MSTIFWASLLGRGRLHGLPTMEHMRDGCSMKLGVKSIPFRSGCLEPSSSYRSNHSNQDNPRYGECSHCPHFDVYSRLQTENHSGVIHLFFRRPSLASDWANLLSSPGIGPFNESSDATGLSLCSGRKSLTDVVSEVDWERVNQRKDT